MGHPGRLFLVGWAGSAAGAMKIIDVLQSLVGKTGFVFTKLSQKLRCLNEQQEERSFDQFVSKSLLLFERYCRV